MLNLNIIQQKRVLFLSECIYPFTWFPGGLQCGVSDIQNPEYRRCHNMPGFNLHLPSVIIQVWACLGAGLENTACNLLFVRVGKQ